MANKRKSEIFETTDFDNAICLTGYGKFHYEMTLVCALCIIIVGFQNGLSSYVFPAAQCELGLTSLQIGMLNVAFLLGGTVSSFLWGVLADQKGRRQVLIFTHLANAATSLICSVIPGQTALMLCRIINGFLIGAPGSIIFSYLAEFQPPRLRSSSVCYCGLFFTASWLLLPIMAYLVLPLPVDYHTSWFSFSSWRLFLILLAIPEALVGFWFMRLPESPKFFFAQTNEKATLQVLRQMYQINSGKPPEKYPVKQLLGISNEEHEEPIVCSNKKIRVLVKMYQTIKSLFYPPLLIITFLTCTIMFANMFGVFGLGLWLPELFIRFQQFQDLHPNSTVTVKQLALLTQVKNVTCEPTFDGAVIRNTVAMALTSLAYNGISGWLSSRVQLRLIPMVSMFLGGLSAGSIYWLTSATQNVIVACIFQASMVTANMTIGSVVVELFPTKVGGIAICLIMCSGRIGAIVSNMVFGYYMDKQPEVPIFVVAITVLVGALLCLLVPGKDSEEGDGKLKRVEYLGNSHVEISVISNSVK